MYGYFFLCGCIYKEDRKRCAHLDEHAASAISCNAVITMRILPDITHLRQPRQFIHRLGLPVALVYVAFILQRGIAVHWNIFCYPHPRDFPCPPKVRQRLR